MLRFKFRGEAARLLLGHFPLTTLEAARARAREYRELASSGIDPRRARPQRIKRTTESAPGDQGLNATHSIEHLVREFIERYLRPTRKRPEYAEAILSRSVLTEWKGRDARTIKPREVIELLDKIVERGRPVMANRTAALLGQLFRFGIHRAIVETTPVQLLIRPGGKEKPRARTLSDAELKTYLAEPTAATRFRRLARVLTILLLTGQRRGELAAARWHDIDLQAGVWRIPAEHAKNGREQAVPLVSWAVDELRRLKKAAGRSPWVLPGKDPSQHLDPKLLTRGVSKCQTRFRQIGVGTFTLHDLRRTCRTGLARLKVEPHIAERVLGHAQERMSATYDTHAYFEEKRAALKKWEDHLRKLTTGTPGS
jgi:integrase